MAGFHNTPPANEFRNYNSWGRTRSPKNILSSHRDGTDGSGTALAVPTAAASGGDAGYQTENQKFLHVNVTATGAATFKIFAFSYACPRWTPLYVNDGSGGLIEASEALNGASGHFIYNIEGIDRVYIRQTGGAGSATAYLACSTL